MACVLQLRGWLRGLLGEAGQGAGPKVTLKKKKKASFAGLDDP